MSRSSLAAGMQVEFTIKGTISTVKQSGALVVKTPDGGFWRVPNDAKWITAKPVVPPHTKVVPGQVWEAAGLKWFARKSRPDLSPRLVPEDMTEAAVAKGISTLPEEEFFTKYPHAKLIFSGVKRKRPQPPTRGELNITPDHFVAGNNGNAILAPATK